MNYRIVIETERSGKQWYYVKKRFMLYFWKYLREVKDMTYHSYKIGWNTLEEAEAHIQSDVNFDYQQSQKKIIRRECVIR